MFYAESSTQERVRASDAWELHDGVWDEDDDCPFFCPMCHDLVTLEKYGKDGLAHFAHDPTSRCLYAGQKESEKHRKAICEIERNLSLCSSGVSSVTVEREMQEVRPNISFVYCGELRAIEVPTGDLFIDEQEIERRIDAYARRRIAVLWLPLLPMEIGREMHYVPTDVEWCLYRLYEQTIYYWLQDVRVLPVHFAGPRLNNGDRVMPVLEAHYPSILDLVPTWSGPVRYYRGTRLLTTPKPETTR